MKGIPPVCPYLGGGIKVPIGPKTTSVCLL